MLSTILYAALLHIACSQIVPNPQLDCDGVIFTLDDDQSVAVPAGACIFGAEFFCDGLTPKLAIWDVASGTDPDAFNCIGTPTVYDDPCNVPGDVFHFLQDSTNCLPVCGQTGTCSVVNVRQSHFDDIASCDDLGSANLQFEGQISYIADVCVDNAGGSRSEIIECNESLGFASLISYAGIGCSGPPVSVDSVYNSCNDTTEEIYEVTCSVNVPVTTTAGNTTALADSCSVDVSLTQFATSRDCATTCWNYCAGAGCDGYAVNSWYGHLGTATSTMLMDDGNVYDEFIVLHPPNNGMGFGEYQLDGSYTRFTGLVGQARSNDAGGCLSGGDWHFIIQVDGVVKFTSQQFNPQAASQYQEVDIDITGATVLRLESYADGSWGCDWATIADPTLWVCGSDGDSCDASEIATFSWDALMSSGTAVKPEVVAFDMSVDLTDLTLNVEIALTYEGRSSADINGGVYGTTYVLDFEDFDAHESSISQPSTCQNRVANDFAGDFNSWWDYSLNPDDVGSNPSFLAYPPPGDLWTVTMADDDQCGVVVYAGKFTWNDLVACQSASGSTPTRNYVTASEDEASGKLNLEGTFYVNVVSPYAATGDLGYYRVYQLVSQPFIISVNKNLQVMNAAGISLFTISVIAVYKEEQASLFKLIVLTESAEYLQLSRTGVAVGLAAFQSSSENSAPLWTEFTVADSTENDGCLNNKAYICSQLWQIEAPGDCSSEQSQYIDFSGEYTLQFTPVCRAAADLDADGVANATALHDYCSGAEGWLATHGDLVTDGVGLTATLQWRDEECDPLLFEVQFEADVLFYTDAVFATVAQPGTLYQVGEDRIYVEIDTVFPGATYDVFDTQLLNVWICTFDPLDGPDLPIEAGALSGGCFSADIDGFNEGVDNVYAYHIFDSQSTVSVPDVVAFDLVGHPTDPITTAVENDKVRFSFVVPPKIARDTLYIHAQIEVSLTGGGSRRRQLLGQLLDLAKANQMQHFLGNVGVSGEPQPRPQQPVRPEYEPLNKFPSVVHTSAYALSLQSPWLMTVAGLLIVVLTLNIFYLCYTRCCSSSSRSGGRVSFAGRRKYKAVKVNDSEVDELRDVISE